VVEEEETVEEILEAEAVATAESEPTESIISSKAGTIPGSEVTGDSKPVASEPELLQEPESEVAESKLTPETEPVKTTQKVVDVPRSPLDEISNYEVSNLKQNFKVTGELHNQPVGDVAGQ